MKAPIELIRPKLVKTHTISKSGNQTQTCITLREWRPSCEWVTNLYNPQTGGYYYGRYFKDLPSAEVDFKQRVLESGGKF